MGNEKLASVATGNVTPSATASLSAAAPAQASATESPAQQAPTHPWDVLARWMERDPRTQPVRTLATARDPFQALKATATPQEAPKTEPKAAVSPATLGIQLSGTVVGAQPRLAVINGRVCREGETIEVGKAPQKATLQLAEVHPRHIVLRWQDERFELAVPERKRTGRLELRAGP